MRKYAIPKVVYVLLIALLSCLSIGYTYAYFSNTALANSNVSMGKINVIWTDSAQNGKPITDVFANTASIPLTGELKRGEYTPLTALDKNGDSKTVKLQIYNYMGTNPEAPEATVGAYCRLKINATYTPEGGTETEFSQEWIKLSLNINSNDIFITELARYQYRGWVYLDGYYYFGQTTTNFETGKDYIQLHQLSVGGGQLVADKIYLSPQATSVLFGAEVKITLTLEGIQTTNGAYNTKWGNLILN